MEVDIPGSEPGATSLNAGFRIDSALSNTDTVNFSEDYLDSDAKGFLQATDPFTRTSILMPDTGALYKAHAQASRIHETAMWGEQKLQLYYEMMEDGSAFPQVSRFETFDLSYQHTWDWAKNQTLVWGSGYRCFERGMDDHVTKPIEPGRLGKALAQFLQSGSSPH